MGEDCCGASSGVAAMTVEDRQGTTEATSSRSHQSYVDEKQPYYARRIELFDKYHKRETDKVEQAKAADVKVKVVLPDGTEKEGVKGATTPMDVARGISGGLAKKVVLAHVDGREWDVNRPLVGDCALKLFSADTDEGLDVRPPHRCLAAPLACHHSMSYSFFAQLLCGAARALHRCISQPCAQPRAGRHTLTACACAQAMWHSSAHVLGQALEQMYGVDLTIGPTIEEGFFYDCFMGAGRGTLTHDDWPAITAQMETAVKAAQPFQRVEISQEEALEMFKENPFKVRDPRACYCAQVAHV